MRWLNEPLPLGIKTMTDAVLIVGAGPVGLTLALELSRYKVPVRLIDKMAMRSDKSRAVALWSRSLELLERAGLSDELLNAGNKVRAANMLAQGRHIARLDFSDVETPYPYALMIPQYDTEAILERQLTSFGISAELGVELVHFVQDSYGVATTLRRSDGTDETSRFSWVIGCDGAHSTIRHKLGLPFVGDTMPIDWTLGDFHMNGSPFGLEELATYWHQDGFIVFFPMAPGRYRIIASLGPSTNQEPIPPSLKEFQEIVDKRGPGGLVLSDSLWTTAFRINERQVANYRSGRIFLAGDSAHVHSPAGGQGMNTGIQAAVNLAWKLALVCRGISDAPELLDSYSSERRPVGAAVIRSAGRLSNLATIRNSSAQQVRNAMFHVIMGLKPMRQVMEESMTEISVGYPKSPLNGVSKMRGPLERIRRATDTPKASYLKRSDTPEVPELDAPDLATLNVQRRRVLPRRELRAEGVPLCVLELQVCCREFLAHRLLDHFVAFIGA